MDERTKYALRLLIECCKENQQLMNKLFSPPVYAETGEAFCRLHKADSTLIGIEHDDDGNVSFFDVKKRVEEYKIQRRSEYQFDLN